MDPSLGRGQHARQRGHPAAMTAVLPYVVLCFIPHRTARRTCSPAIWPSSAASRTASRRRRAALLPAPSPTTRSNTVFGRMGNSRVTDLCDKTQAWTTGWRRLRAHSDDEFREAVTSANSSPSTSRQSRLRRACPHADADETKLIAIPPALASAPPMSNVTVFHTVMFVEGNMSVFATWHTLWWSGCCEKNQNSSSGKICTLE